MRACGAGDESNSGGEFVSRCGLRDRHAPTMPEDGGDRIVARPRFAYGDVGELTRERVDERLRIGRYRGDEPRRPLGEIPWQLVTRPDSRIRHDEHGRSASAGRWRPSIS